MKTINKIAAILLILTVLFVSCEDEITRDPSPETNPNSTNVYFSDTNEASPILGIEATSFDVVIEREKTADAQVVGLSASSVYKDLFDVPESVAFEAGESEASVTIKVKELELMKKYPITLNIASDQTQPYRVQDNYSRLELHVLQEDFAPYAKGTYKSIFYESIFEFESEWEAILEYSPATELYRFKDCWMPGYDVLFQWDQETNEVLIQGTKNSTGAYIYLQTGGVHPTYGMVSAYYEQADIKYYNPETKTFTFPILWVDPDGAWGVYPDSYTIEEEL